MATAPPARDVTSPPCEPISVWGLPLAPWTFAQTLDEIDRLIAAGEPRFFITANLHYAMLADRLPQLREVNRQAAFLLADGMPLVWWSRFRGRPLPERVTGSDLVYLLAERAAERGHRLFLLGGPPGVAAAAADELRRRYPRLEIAGVECPPFRPLSDAEEAGLLARIRAARADILLAALGQPKGELWLARRIGELGVPACVQVGATLDFVAGRVRRAPRWMQRVGLEWLYRIGTEPRRLLPRYTQDFVFLLKAIYRDLFRRR